MIGVALKTPLQIRLGICMYKMSLLHRPDDHIVFTPSRPPHILQQNCTHWSYPNAIKKPCVSVIINLRCGDSVCLCSMDFASGFKH